MKNLKIIIVLVPILFSSTFAYSADLKKLWENEGGTVTKRSPDLSGLDYEEKQSIEIACINEKTRGPAAYNQCLRTQLALLRAGTRRPDLSGLDYEEKQSIEIACINEKTRGPAAYNQCLRTQLALLGVPIREIEIKKPKPQRIIKKPSILSEHVSPKDIRKVQAILYELGYDAGPIDGILGKKTREAIIEFQLDIGVPITGKVDKNLLSLLTTALQIAKRNKKTEPPVQISKQSPSPYSKVPKPAKVLPSMPSIVYREPLTAADLFRKVQSSIYVVIASSSIIEIQRGENILQGSAVAVSQKCLLTNCHVLENRPYVLIIQGEDVLPARLSGIEKESDMCVLTIKKSNLIPISAIREFDDLMVGEKVYTVGTPVGLEQTLGEGIISGLRKHKGLKLIQTSAPISSGSSGGGLFDVSGNLIGITTFLLKDAQNLNFAIAAEQYWK
jgi:peptidoglycan hydrolase-like protein with peptidoglycan-binding domain